MECAADCATARADRLRQSGSASDGSILLGVEENELQPLAIDFTQQLHLLIIGDSECGKTATLRTVCRELVRTTNPDQCQLFIVDLRRSLLDVVEPSRDNSVDTLRLRMRSTKQSHA